MSTEILLEEAGTAKGEASGLWNGVPFPVAADAIYLCDAGCRPNPGVHLPLVWNGEVFLDISPETGTNHTAAYQSVLAALDDAKTRGIKAVELRLTSPLVFTQLSTGMFCRNKTLDARRVSVEALANSVGSVRLVLVGEPFNLGQLVFATKRALRNYHRQWQKGHLTAL